MLFEILELFLKLQIYLTSQSQGNPLRGGQSVGWSTPLIPSHCIYSTFHGKLLPSAALETNGRSNEEATEYLEPVRKAWKVDQVPNATVKHALR